MLTINEPDTPTSAKHIAKFTRDYSGIYEFSCPCYRYYNI